MFYRLFGKLNKSKDSSGANSSGAASATAAASSLATPANAGAGGSGGVNGALALEPNTPSGAANSHHGKNQNSSAFGGAGDGGGDRRAFQGEERLLEHPRGPRRYPLDPEDNSELLVLLAQQYSITSVVITHYRVKENYVEYVIECVRGYDAWRVYRRYQQFKALDRDLRQLCVGRHGSNHGAYGVLPVLPGSHWMDITNQSPELVEQRRRYLEIYLQQLLVPKNLFYVARTVLYDFLHEGEVPTHLNITGIRPLLGLISTCTNQIDCDDSDEAIQREQRQSQQHHQQSEAAHMEGENPATSSIAFPTVSAVAVSENTMTTTTNIAAAYPSESGKHESTSAGDAQSATPASAEHTSIEDEVLSPGNCGVPASSATSCAAAGSAATRHPSGKQESFDNGRDTDDGEGNKTEEKQRANKNARALVDKVAFVPTGSMDVSFTDERLPPASANCAQCNAEFTSFLYPHRCFFCRLQFCTSCLQKLSLLENGSSPNNAAAGAVVVLAARELAISPLQTTNAAGEAPKAVTRSALACRQCAENYNRRLDRCIAAPGGGAYRGMQSTLGLLSHGSCSNNGGGVSTNGATPPSSLTSPAPSVSPNLSPAACVGGERSSMLLQKRNTGPSSLQMRGSPASSFARRSGGLSAVGFHDFQLLTVIGRGTFGKVLKVRHRSTGKVYAMKIMNKAIVYKRCMTSYMKEEKLILTTMKPHPYIVCCYYAFQTEYYLVFVMDYLPGGELYDYLYPKLRLSPDAACIYAAELVLALEHLHRQDVVHRDLKPENVVLAADGHICLTDFGLARSAFSRSRRRSFIGSPEYVAPETIQGQVQTAAVDWWSFGIMLYEMLTGYTPFHARNNNTVYDNVLHKELKLPLMKTVGAAAGTNAAARDGVAILSPSSPSTTAMTTATAPAASSGHDKNGFKGFTPEAASLLSGLLTRDASMRLQDVAVIKQHPFFRNIDWEALQHKNVRAPCIPGDLRDNDVRYFKREFVSEWASVPPLTNVTRASIEALTKCFENFPLSRISNSPSSSLAASIAPSTTKDLPQITKSAADGSLPEMRALSPSLVLLPSPVLSTDSHTLREPVHFGQSVEAARRCFHGVWRVVSIEVHALEDSRVIFPWGGNVAGLLVYCSDGRFSLQLSPSTRRPMGPVQRVELLSKEDLCDAYCSYVASFGHFQLFPASSDDGCGVVRHYAEGNLCPNLMLTSTVFQYRMDVEPSSKEIERRQREEVLSNPNSVIGSLKEKICDDTDVLPKPMRVPSTCNSESSMDGCGVGGRHSETGSLPRESDKANVPIEVSYVQRTASPPPPTPARRRFVLRLSTRPQRAFEEDFMAFTSLVFEKFE